jgi:hypothetical protein
VRIGVYTVTAELPGFETARHIQVELNVQRQVVIDFSLRPGQLTETVGVTGTPTLLQTQNASLGQVVASRQINDLPLNGRAGTCLSRHYMGRISRRLHHHRFRHSGPKTTETIHRRNDLLQGVL